MTGFQTRRRQAVPPPPQIPPPVVPPLPATTSPLWAQLWAYYQQPWLLQRLRDPKGRYLPPGAWDAWQAEAWWQQVHANPSGRPWFCDVCGIDRFTNPGAHLRRGTPVWSRTAFFWLVTCDCGHDDLLRWQDLRDRAEHPHGRWWQRHPHPALWAGARLGLVWSYAALGMSLRPVWEGPARVLFPIALGLVGAVLIPVKPFPWGRLKQVVLWMGVYAGTYGWGVYGDGWNLLCSLLNSAWCGYGAWQLGTWRQQLRRSRRGRTP